MRGEREKEIERERDDHLGIFRDGYSVLPRSAPCRGPVLLSSLSRLVPAPLPRGTAPLRTTTGRRVTQQGSKDARNDYARLPSSSRAREKCIRMLRACRCRDTPRVAHSNSECELHAQRRTENEGEGGRMEEEEEKRYARNADITRLSREEIPLSTRICSVRARDRKSVV